MASDMPWLISIVDHCVEYWDKYIHVGIDEEKVDVGDVAAYCVLQAKRIADHVPYGERGPARIRHWHRATYGNCVDAAAWMCGFGIANDARAVGICYKTNGERSHVTPVVDGVPIEVWPARAPPVSWACSHLVDVRTPVVVRMLAQRG
jgi:hypothetical protein